MMDEINEQLNCIITAIAADKVVVSHLKSSWRESDKGIDWADPDNYYSSDFRYYFEEFYHGRMPGRQPILTDPEWAILSIVDHLVDTHCIRLTCLDIADEFRIDADEVHQRMIQKLWMYLIDAASSIN